MEKPKLPVFKFGENLPEFLEFKFNEFKSGEGQYGRWYLTTIVNRGVDKTFFPSEVLVGLLNSYQPLQGKTLEITKIKDSEYNSWDIKENGVSQTTQKPPQASQPASLPNMVQTDPNERIDKMAGKFSEMKKDLNDLYEMIKEQGSETAKLRERLDKLENPDKTFHADNLSDHDRGMADALGIPII